MLLDSSHLSSFRLLLSVQVVNGAPSTGQWCLARSAAHSAAPATRLTFLGKLIDTLVPAPQLGSSVLFADAILTLQVVNGRTAQASGVWPVQQRTAMPPPPGLESVSGVTLTLRPDGTSITPLSPQEVIKVCSEAAMHKSVRGWSAHVSGCCATDLFAAGKVLRSATW